jgi:hypothetical protein
MTEVEEADQLSVVSRTPEISHPYAAQFPLIP